MAAYAESNMAVDIHSMDLFAAFKKNGDLP